MPKKSGQEKNENGPTEGSAWVGKGQWRYVTAAREIRRGKNKGMFEVVTPDGRKHKTPVFRPHVLPRKGGK